MWGTTYISTVSMYDYPTVTIEQPLYVRLCITFTGEVAPPPAPSRPRYPAAPGRSMMMTTMTMMIMFCGFSHRGPHSPVRPSGVGIIHDTRAMSRCDNTAYVPVRPAPLYS